MCTWVGGFPGCTFPPEYAAYQSPPYTYDQEYLSEDQSIMVMSTDYTWYGMNNIYNAMLMFRDYEIVKKDWITPSAYWGKAC